MQNRPGDRDLHLKRAKRKLVNAGCDAILVSDPGNIEYFTNTSSLGAFVLVPARGKAVFFIDKMNYALAVKMLEGLDIDIITDNARIKAVAAFIKDKKYRKIGFNERALPEGTFRALERSASKIKFKPLASLVQDMRTCKGDDEIRLLKKAAKETVVIWNEVKHAIRTGMTEREIAAMVDIAIRKRGHTNSFPTIAAIGRNSAFPHAIPSSRRLRKGEHVLVDFGIKYNGYCSDLTRTWDNGRINRKIKDLRNFVLTAQERAIKKLKSGVNIGSLARDVNGYFHKNGLSGYILHSLGHGVGLDIHEEPYLSERSSRKLKKGMVVTIEPGLYVPGVGGIREEDMALITAKGCEVLTK